MNTPKNNTPSNCTEQYTRIQTNGHLIGGINPPLDIDAQMYENFQSYLDYHRMINDLILDCPELSDRLYFDKDIYAQTNRHKEVINNDI